jgi:hypothetical protein
LLLKFYRREALIENPRCELFEHGAGRSWPGE